MTRSRVARAGRSGLRGLIGLVLLLAALIAGVAILRNWVQIGVDVNDEQDRMQVAIQVDRERAHEDLAAAESRLESVAETVLATEDTKVLEGTITQLSRSAGEITLRREDGREERFALTSDTKIELTGTPEDLEVGDEVAITYREQDDEKKAVRIERP